MGGATINQVHSDFGGLVWVDLPAPLAAGDAVTARQTNASGSSDESAHPVPVIETPNPLPGPVFDSLLTTYMSKVMLDGLVPGAQVEIRQQGVLIGQRTATRTRQSVPLDPGIKLTPFVALEASQSIALGGGQTISSPTVPSLPIIKLNLDVLPAPPITEPVLACQSRVIFAGVAPSAEVQIENEGSGASWLNVDAWYSATAHRPFQEGTLVARQFFSRHNLTSPDTQIKVAPTSTPTALVLSHYPCAANRRVQVAGLVPGATVTLFSHDVAIGDPSRKGPETVLGEAQASASAQEFDLPADLNVRQDEVRTRIGARQQLCGLTSPDSDLVLFAEVNPATPLAIIEPIYACVRHLRVNCQTIGRTLQARDAGTGQPLGDQVTSRYGDNIVDLWFGLTAGQIVLIHQRGCGNDADSNPVKVQSLPTDLPIPVITEPLRPAQTSVEVSGLLPGARVHLLGQGGFRGHAESLFSTATVPVNPPLAEDERLWAIQTLCTKQSQLTGRGPLVRRGTLEVSAKPGRIFHGSTTSITVTAFDAQTGAPVDAQVLCDGKPVGRTGGRFPLTPQPGQTEAVILVRHPGYHDATTKVLMTEPAPSQPVGTLLRLEASPKVLKPGVLELIDANWTVSTVWTDAQTFTASGASASIELPNPPGGNDKRIFVSLDAQWRIDGSIDGYHYPKQDSTAQMVDGDPQPVGWTSQVMTANWVFGWARITDTVTGEAVVIVQTKFVGVT